MSDLCSYCDDAAGILVQVLNDPELTRGGDLQSTSQIQQLRLPAAVSEVFFGCIRSGEADVAAHLANILSNLQIFGARMRGLGEPRIKHGITRVFVKDEILGYLVYLAITRAHINKTFVLARGGELSSAVPTIDEVGTALREMDVLQERVEGLGERVQRAFPTVESPA